MQHNKVVHTRMTKFMISIALVVVLLPSTLISVQAQMRSGEGFAAVPGEKGGQDFTGPYDVVPNWPKPLSSLPKHEKWRWGAAQGVFAESPNRVFIVQRGELPDLPRSENTQATQLGQPRWEHCIAVVNAEGDMIEDWTKWDPLFKQPHSVFINPYDPEKHVWVVDNMRDAIFEFTNDGKILVKTLGTPNEPGADDTHFAQPTSLAWFPDGTMLVSDGYVNTRIVKLDKNGKFLMDWGEKGNPPTDMRPGYFNTVHNVLVDPRTRRVYVNDRGNHRVQVFDENGKFLDQWNTGSPPESDVQAAYLSADGFLWMADRGTSKILEYDLAGHFLYSWGSRGQWPGGLWGVHGMSVDQEGNLYLAEVSNGRVEKLTPRKGANPTFLVGLPLHVAWR
jgi:hypothetical protein